MLNKQAANVQITAEQLFREASERMIEHVAPVLLLQSVFVALASLSFSLLSDRKLARPQSRTLPIQMNSMIFASQSEKDLRIIFEKTETASATGSSLSHITPLS